MNKKAHDTQSFTPEIVTKPQGYVLLKLEKESIAIKLDFNAMADADEYLKGSALQRFVDDPMNLATIRALFFFGIREQKKDIKTVRDAGALLSGISLDIISEAVVTAMEVSGVMKPEDLEAAQLPANGEAQGES